jgi:hypothetical protein
MRGHLTLCHTDECHWQPGFPCHCHQPRLEILRPIDEKLLAISARGHYQCLTQRCIRRTVGDTQLCSFVPNRSVRGAIDDRSVFGDAIRIALRNCRPHPRGTRELVAAWRFGSFSRTKRAQGRRVPLLRLRM